MTSDFGFYSHINTDQHILKSSPSMENRSLLNAGELIRLVFTFHANEFKLAQEPIKFVLTIKRVSSSKNENAVISYSPHVVSNL